MSRVDTEPVWTHDGYTIRLVEPDDLEAYLSLYETVFEQEVDEAWFDWKYADNPYLDRTAVFVAENDDRLVGGLGCFALALATGEGSVLAIEPGDAMVHPDHRRRGIFIELMRAGIEYFRPREPAFYFDLIPGTGPYHGNQKHLDWRRVDELSTYYRVQNPAALAGTRFGRSIGKLAMGGFHSLYDRALGRDVDGVEVDRQPAVPVDTFTTLYRESVPHRFHALRDERFYRWRFTNPHWDYAAYVARRDGAPVAGMVTGTRESAGVRTTRVMDVVPMTGGFKREREFGALLEAIVRGHRDADVLAVPPGFVPHGVLTAYGFRRDDVPPISRWSTPYRHGVRPFAEDDDALVVDGMRLTDGTNWLVSFVEQDTS